MLMLLTQGHFGDQLNIGVMYVKGVRKRCVTEMRETGKRQRSQGTRHCFHVCWQTFGNASTQLALGPQDGDSEFRKNTDPSHLLREQLTGFDAALCMKLHGALCVM